MIFMQGKSGVRNGRSPNSCEKGQKKTRMRYGFHGQRGFDLLKRWAITAAVPLSLLFLMLTTGDAFAQVNYMATKACTSDGLGEMLCTVIKASDRVPGLFSGVSYLLGLVLGYLALIKTKDHVISPERVTLWEPIRYFVAGGAFFSLPILFEAAKDAVSKDLTPAEEAGWNGKVGAGGLDVVFVNFMEDIFSPMHFLVGAYSYLVAIVLIMIAINRILKSAQEGPRGPGGFGTIMTVLVAGIFFSLDDILGAFSVSMFGDAKIATLGQFKLTGKLGLTTGQEDHAMAVVSSILAFMKVVGIISVVRGFFILRDVADGNGQASLMASMTHLFGGALAINLGPLLNSAQTTFGTQDLGLQFCTVSPC